MKLYMPFDLPISLLGNHLKEIIKNVDTALGTLQLDTKKPRLSNLLQDGKSYGHPAVTARLAVPANTNHQTYECSHLRCAS